ncbi:sodium/hydrogen exchanger [Myriangium duriaei CBS 260.36]|uniref:Sodium/hydrogen exchanger n=1 Tax=Myriangium duriaei CBS 260.36 TaxID=1168546 RepID=A0A9P4MKE0_9PEZI|nr:sodium/hydrogen exchanger [Myriangium duriaei CBS 260.36]
MSSKAVEMAFELLKRQTDSDSDPEAEPGAGQKEVLTSWSLFILIMLLIVALFTSYLLQTRKIQAVHETVISIFAGMVVGLVLRLTAAQSVLGAVSFDYQFFFNLLLPPIILASGYELHQGNFFRNIGAILTFAFAGTFISAVVLGVILYLWTRIPLEGLDITFVEAMAVGATLSATDPVTILAIFNTYKVDPKLYTIIFGESILNDAVAIVLFETAQKYMEGAAKGHLTILSLFESIGIFLLVFFGSLIIGLLIGIGTSLLLKYTRVRRYPKIESCLIILIAYASYFFANAIHMSGIVSLLFCGICLKHYAYHNMSRRTQLTTKFIFQITAQLSENFIFIYLGLSLFTEAGLEYKPLFILVATAGICVARYCAVFPLSYLVNGVIRYRARKAGRPDAADELPRNHQMMLFWAGLRGAVGVALAAGLGGKQRFALRATVLVVVVLTVIIFGGTTARMLEILEIRTGVVEEIDSDDEFDIEIVPNSNGTFKRRSGGGFGHNPRQSQNGGINLSRVRDETGRPRLSSRAGLYSTGNVATSPRPESERGLGRRNSSRNDRRRDEEQNQAERGLLSQELSFDDGADDDDMDLDLPPAARRTTDPAFDAEDISPGGGPYGHTHSESQSGATLSARGAISQLLSTTGEDAATVFSRLDEGFIKPHLLLDPGSGNRHGPGGNGDV